MATESILHARLAPRIVEEDGSFRSKMLAIAAGLPEVIAMGRGDPDFHTPKHIAEAAKAAIDANQHHYTGPTGLPALREAIAANLKAEFGLDYTADEIVVTAGVQESIMLCMLGMVAPGDEVLITSPRFTTYDTAVHLCGGVPIPVPTHEENDFALDVAEIEKRITPRTRAFVLVSPNNPTGAVTPPEVIRQIAEMAERHDILVIADEIYAKLIYPPHEHLSLATLPGMKSRTITLNGFSKTYSMTGWRVGYLAAPADYVAKLTEPRHTLSINTCTISQFAALAALTGPQDEIEAMHAAYAERRAYLMEALTAAGLTYGAPGGAFYIYTNISSTGMDAPAFCEGLLRETGVMVFPGTMFGDDSTDYIRISYLQPLDRIREAMDRIAGFIARHGTGHATRSGGRA
jgi:aspartate/methionine/tyrosine aminotransferase